MVLLVLISSKSKFFHLALSFPQIFVSISKSPIFSIKLRFKLSNSCLHFDHGLLSSLKSIYFSLISTSLCILALGLKKRREAGTKPFTVMSCDNIPHNGVVARNAVAGVARLWDKGLADWIAATASFPNGMVDRITPATTDRERKLCAQDFGIEDNWPVYCEEFIQWVLEDNFCNGRPELEAVGVQFVPDVTPFEFMKIRILNGGHAAIAYPASLLDVHFVHDAMNHPLVGAFFAKIEHEEIIPTVPPVPGVVRVGAAAFFRVVFLAAWRAISRPLGCTPFIQAPKGGGYCFGAVDAFCAPQKPNSVPATRRIWISSEPSVMR